MLSRITHLWVLCVFLIGWINPPISSTASLFEFSEQIQEKNNHTSINDFSLINATLEEDENDDFDEHFEFQGIPLSLYSESYGCRQAAQNPLPSFDFCLSFYSPNLFIAYCNFRC